MILAWNFLFRQGFRLEFMQGMNRVWGRVQASVWTGFGEGFRLVFGQDSGRIWARVQARV